MYRVRLLDAASKDLAKLASLLPGELLIECGGWQKILERPIWKRSLEILRGCSSCVLATTASSMDFFMKNGRLSFI